MTEQNDNQIDTTKPQEIPLKVILQYAGVLLTLATAFLYLLGYVHYGTYLSWWGLSDSLFPLSKDQSIISGFFRTLLYSASILRKLPFVMYLLFGVMFVTFVSCYRPITEWFSKQCLRFESKAVPALRRNVIITSVHDKLMNTIELIVRGIAVFFIILVVVVFSCKWVADKANIDASTKHAEIISGKESSKLFSSRATLHVKNGAKTFDIYSGHLIMTSATHTALYSKNKGMMIFPITNVARIDLPEKVINGNGKVSP